MHSVLYIVHRQSKISFIEHEQILCFEEILEIVRVVVEMGINVRLTGRAIEERVLSILSDSWK